MSLPTNCARIGVYCPGICRILFVLGLRRGRKYEAAACTVIALTTENTSPFQKGLTLFNSGIDWCRCVEDALSRLKRDAGYMVILMSCLKKAEKLKDLKPESIKTNFLGEVVFEDLDDRKEICSRYGSMMSATSARFKQAHN